ncbi:orotidine-5'-phosphate decarboxylase [Oligoflexia bacterium]|nr:orotidine-5'-phosphate decarboxylase [Oligoflexia bacterium]
MTKHSADLIMQRIDEKSNPSVVGLDPRLSMLPAEIREAALKEFGDTFEGAGYALLQFNKQIIDNIADIVAIVKPQMAFYEQYGHHGVKAFQETVQYAHAKGMLVIGDSKRNDIGSTAAAYAAGHLGEVELFNSSQKSLDVDWLTVNAYLGEDGVAPFCKMCEQYGKGIFVLVKTSNPSSKQFQDVELTNAGKPLYVLVAETMHTLATNYIGEKGYSSLGAVVGATYPEEAVVVRRILKSSYLLVPGFGAQGGGAEDTLPFFNDDGYGAVVNSSRGIIFAYKQDGCAYQEDQWTSAVRDAAITMRDDIVGVLRKYNKLPHGW